MRQERAIFAWGEMMETREVGVMDVYNKLREMRLRNIDGTRPINIDILMESLAEKEKSSGST